MDLTAFADFVLAWDHRSHPAAIKYFFPVLDLKNQEVHVMWVNMGEYADLSIYDVVDEILDMS
ncbi:serine/threonine-protein phosphatase 2A regulatory subunit B'' subunit gamma [Haematococcus lacustris]|uniref:Serine/threonine-protein phosphatase 2A regulatory subunit B'' subunit gamma n=1 Tax=Haematococcus lacustris TaxID=44745 RepID=A0A699Z506_HAELA|nr:serine/threonine-protein phosphatase 2A regulatory subunit B'' subunit gamma [Haematococcus lacustris]